MAIEIEEKFEVAAPIDAVWQFVMDPHKVAACMPGAKLEEVLDERNFVGSIRVKVGAISAAYKGKVQLTEVNVATYTVEMAAEGTETGGGTAKGTMSSALRALGDGRTELVATATVDLTGRIMQVGRGMIQGVSHQLFKQFVAKAKRELEAAGPSAAAAGAEAGATTAQPAPMSRPPAASEGDAIRVIPLLFHTLLAAIANFFRRLFGRAVEGK